MSQKKKLQDLIEKSIKNIEEDRGVTNKLLTDLLIYMTKTGDTAHNQMGHVAAQYLETLQRSNEQLVKITSIVQRQEGGSRGMSQAERDGLFDIIKEDK
jgi:hypothetical protein